MHAEQLIITITMQTSLLSIVVAIFALVATIQGAADPFLYTVHASPGIDIQSIDVTPMPIQNPGEALLTFTANLKRPIRKHDATRRRAQQRLPD